MPDYLLDTNILTYWYDASRPQHANVLSNVQRIQQPDPETGYVSRLFISVVTLAEIEYGHAVTEAPDEPAQTSYLDFIEQELPPALEISRRIRKPYAALRAWLFNNYSPKAHRTRAKRPEQLVDPTSSMALGIQENDLWIAAHAALHNLVLVTADGLARLVRAIEKAGVGPTVENWANMPEP